jgi:endo-1,3-1,4-beta-glycanase ExoK
VTINSRIFEQAILPTVLFGAVAAFALASTSLARAEEPQSPGSFVENFDKLDTSRWYISDGWTNGKHQNCTWSKHQVSVKNGVLNLGFAKAQTKDRAYACSEIRTKKRYGYGTYEARMKTAAGAGLDLSFFTYIGETDKQPHDEIDFEVLGKNPSKVQLNYFTGGKGGHEQFVEVPGGADADFHDYAFVWEKDRIRWYIDGKLVRTVEDPAALPSHPSNIFMNVWGSDTLSSWLGRFAEPNEPLTLQIDRVAFTAPGDHCQFPESIACSSD